MCIYKKKKQLPFKMSNVYKWIKRMDITINSNCVMYRKY